MFFKKYYYEEQLQEQWKELTSRYIDTYLEYVEFRIKSIGIAKKYKIPLNEIFVR